MEDWSRMANDGCMKNPILGYLIGGVLIFSLIAKSNFLYFSQVLVRRFLQNYVAPIFDLCVNIVLHWWCSGGGWGGGGMLTFMYMLRWWCYVDDVQGLGGVGMGCWRSSTSYVDDVQGLGGVGVGCWRSCTCYVDDVTLMMFRGWVGWGWDVDVHVHVTLVMLRWWCSGYGSISWNPPPWFKRKSLVLVRCSSP